MTQWRTVFDHEMYEISDDGRVRRVATGLNGRRPHELKTTRSGTYLTVQLYRDGVRSPTRTVHRLVCEAFHGPAPSTAHQVAHADGNPMNNQAANLRWCTGKENAEDRRLHGRHPVGSASARAKLDETDIPLIRRLAGQGWRQRDIAKRFGVHQVTVWRVIHRKTFRHVAGPLVGVAMSRGAA